MRPKSEWCSGGRTTLGFDGTGGWHPSSVTSYAVVLEKPSNSEDKIQEEKISSGSDEKSLDMTSASWSATDKAVEVTPEGDVDSSSAETGTETVAEADPLSS